MPRSSNADNSMKNSTPTSFKQKVLRAGGWTMAGYALNQALRLGGNLIMTRLLLPEMFGVMAIATIVSVIIWLLSDTGLNQNIVQSERGNDPLFLDTAWVVQIFRGVILWAASLIIAAALYLANLHGLVPANTAYADPVLPLVIAVNSASLLISCLQSTRVGTAYRDLNQKRLNQISLISHVAGFAFMVIVGVATRSIWALVVGGHVTALVGTVLSHTWMPGHANRYRVEKAALHELLGFGKWILLSSTVYVLAANGDRMLLGAFVDARQLGLYAIAALMVTSVEGAMTRLFGTVSLPALSEIVRTNPARLREVYYKFRIPCDLLLLFVAGLLCACGQLIIDLLYDHRYASSGSILQVLALSLIATRYGISHQLYLAMGNSRHLAIINGARFLSLFTLVPVLGYFFGMDAAIWGIALHAFVTLPIVYMFNASARVNDVRREIVVLIALPAGFLFGSLVNWILA